VVQAVKHVSVLNDAPRDPASRICLCGHLRVEVAGTARESQLRGRQGRLLFAYLVLHRDRQVRRDELVDALWAQAGTPPRETALAPVLSRMRGALAPATIDGRESLSLALPEPAWIDVEAAAAALARARGAGDPAAQLEAARAAADLTDGGLLPGLDARWLDEQRAAVADTRIEALELAARAGANLGGAALGQAEADARAAVGAAPFRESARVALIEVLRARGNVAEAVRAYEDLRTLLREELGTVPGPELVALHEQLLGLGAAGARPPAAGGTGERGAASGFGRAGGRRAAGGLAEADAFGGAGSAGRAGAAGAAAPPSPAPADLVERDDELEEVEAALDHLVAGDGGVVVFEGPAGIGKTRLLSELRARALRGGARVLDARAGVLERDYGFGVARQLLSGAVAAEPALLDGAAAPARGVVAAAAGATDSSFAVLDALFHLTAALAARGPVVVCVDDLQWSDPASLRFVAYLARRVSGLPILVAATVRTGEPDVDEALLAELSHDPEATALRPAPLTAAATRALVRARLGQDADGAFASACHEVTAGNPLLVRQLLTALKSERVAPDAAHAEEVRAVGPRAVSRTVLLRLARLPDETVAVARAVAILGEDPALQAVAALAGVDEPTAAAAVQVLARAEILREDAPLGFVHPLVRDAVYSELPAAGRGLEHARAARLLADLGATPESVAAQLLLAPPRGDPWVVERLREAANVAIARGAPDSATALLERAQAEPPPPELRATIALELGGSAAFVSGPAAVEPLRLAYAALTDPAERALAAVKLSRLLMFVTSPRDGADLAARAMAELPEEHDDLRKGLLAIRLVGVFFGVVDPAELAVLEEVRRGPRDTGPGARTLTVMAALTLAIGCGPSGEAAALAWEAMHDDAMLRFDAGVITAGAQQVAALAEPADGVRAAERMGSFARPHSLVLAIVGADLWGSVTLIWRGDLAAAVAWVERAYEGERLWGTTFSAVMGYSAAFLALAQLEIGDRERAWASLRRIDGSEGTSDGARFWLASHAELLLADDRPDEALAVARRLQPMRPPNTHPVWAPWRSLRARALVMLGRRDEAAALATEDLALARQTEAPWVIGRGLRILGEIEGAPGIDRVREATALLDGTSARLERAKAHAALAAVATGSEADTARATARELARRCGAEGLVAALGD
jgi:DNA-binding SARP family transcriptional activator